MKADIWNIVDYSLEIMKSAILDLNHLNDKVNKENRKEVMGLLFKGIIHIVTIPMTSSMFSKQIPLLGKFIEKPIKKILPLVAEKVSFDKVLLNEELGKKEDKPRTLELYLNSITSASDGLEKVVDLTYKIARMPILISFALSLLLSIVLVYFVNR